MPPNVDCPSVISQQENIEQKAFLEYLEQKDRDITDKDLDINTIVSRNGFYACFCRH